MDNNLLLDKFGEAVKQEEQARRFVRNPGTDPTAGTKRYTGRVITKPAGKPDVVPNGPNPFGHGELVMRDGHWEPKQARPSRRAGPEHYRPDSSSVRGRDE
jgi:hypothetical protein